MTARLKEIMKSFAGKRVLIIGDLMLDKTTKGAVSRVSPEAPVPVLEIQEEYSGPGGAGNVAANIASLSGNATVCGFIGNDEQGVLLLNTLKEKGINTGTIVTLDSQTTTKERVICGKQHLVRIDTETVQEPSAEKRSALLKEADSAIASANAVIIADYAKGAIDANIARHIIHACKNKRIPLIADVKPENLSWYPDSAIIVLNKEEAYEALGKRSEDWQELGSALHAKTNSAILITRGANDSVLFDGTLHHIIVPKNPLIDKSGSGDTLSAMLALALCSGATIPEAAQLANHAASIVVSKEGVSSVSIEEVLAILRHDISQFIRENIQVKQAVIDTQLGKVEALARHIMDVYTKHKKILIFGNGGSAADAQHFAAELVGRYKMERRALPAIALTTDTSAITAIANDYSYDKIFERQVEALAQPGDLVIGITTSGNSPNVNLAIEYAKSIGCITVGLGGKDGGKLKEIADLSIIVPSNNTPRIQETHITIIHIVCELLEKEMGDALRNAHGGHP